MNVQYITDERGRRTAVVIPMEEWERAEKAREILEHVYLAGIIEERKGSKAAATIDDLLKQEGLSRAELED